MGRMRITVGVDLPMIDDFNKMQASFRVRVEWGIGGLKKKIISLKKIFDLTRPTYSQLFRVGVCQPISIVDIG